MKQQSQQPKATEEESIKSRDEFVKSCRMMGRVEDDRREFARQQWEERELMKAEQ